MNMQKDLRVLQGWYLSFSSALFVKHYSEDNYANNARHCGLDPQSLKNNGIAGQARNDANDDALNKTAYE